MRRHRMPGTGIALRGEEMEMCRVDKRKNSRDRSGNETQGH